MTSFISIEAATLTLIGLVMIAAGVGITIWTIISPWEMETVPVNEPAYTKEEYTVTVQSER